MPSTQAAEHPVSQEETQVRQYLGRQVWLQSKSFNRYLGILSAIDRGRASISLSHVVSFGSEGRLAALGRGEEEAPPSETALDLVVFRATDVEQIQLVPLPPGASPSATGPTLTDPAIVHATSRRPAGQAMPLPVHTHLSLAQQSAHLSQSASTATTTGAPQLLPATAPDPLSPMSPSAPTTPAASSASPATPTADPPAGTSSANTRSHMGSSTSPPRSIPVGPSSRKNQPPTSLPTKPLPVRPQTHPLPPVPHSTNRGGRTGRPSTTRGRSSKRATGRSLPAVPQGSASEAAGLPPLVLPDGLPDTSRTADFDFEQANARFSRATELERPNEAAGRTEQSGYNKQAGFFDRLTCPRAPRGGGRGRQMHEAQRNLATFGEAGPAGGAPAW